MRITETARLFISLPFRADGLETEHPGCLKQFDSRQIDRFLAALYREIDQVSGECDDLLVREIIIGNGSVSHLTADDLTRTISCIKEHFHVSREAKTRFFMTPSGFDFYKLNSVRQVGGEICFEIPALTDELLQTAGYHCSAENAKSALECCFQNGFRHYSVSLTTQFLDPNEAEMTLNTLLSVYPEAVWLRKDADERFLKIADGILTKAAWIRDGNCWYREIVPRPLHCEVQIGCGPNAVSIYDNNALRSTADFDYYCSHSDDFEALVKHSESDHLQFDGQKKT